MLPSLDEASVSVDALVADDAAEFLQNTVDFVPNMADFTPAPNVPTTSIGFDLLTPRTSTPSVPPGLALPHAHPPQTLREDPVIKPVSRIVPTSAPFTPSRNLPSAYIPRAATPLSQMSFLTPLEEVSSPKATNVLTSQAKQDVKALATKTGLSRTIASQSAQGLQQLILRPDDFPVLEKGKERQGVPVGPKSMALVPKKLQTPICETLPKLSTAKATSKRSVPGILNIATLYPAGKAANESSDSVGPVSSSAFPPLPPSAPSSAVLQSPAARSNPKTLRLIPTPKAEVPPTGSATPHSATSTNPTNVLPPSRQPSIVSLSRTERPGTPVSEIISDNASITSNSLSRPSSPPATRVGSAPVRSTTKSQQKKHRREAQKEKSELITVVDKPEAEVEIAPIMGRKKKQKKEKVSSNAGGPSPAISRAASPGPQETIHAENSPKPEGNAETIVPNKTQQLNNTASSKASESNAKAKSKNEEQTPVESPMSRGEAVDEHVEKPIPAPASVLSDLVISGLLPDPTKLVLFKSPIGPSQRPETLAELQDIDNKLIISDEDRASLQGGKPVHKIGQGSNRIMLTPNGDCVRNLTAEEEERYLELQSRILADSGPATFIPPRHTVGGGFALIGGRAVPNGPPAYFPPVDSMTPNLDPISKIQRDEALSYINQYVLPSLSTNSQLEKALNANALDAEILGANEPFTWGSWVSPANGARDDAEASTQRRENPYPMSRDNSILATGLQSMTAHFALGQETGRTQALGNVTLLSLEDSEKALQSAKKETEKLEKSLNQLLKKNRRLLLGAGH